MSTMQVTCVNVGVGDVVAEHGVATGDDALTLLDNTTTRNAFVDELMEVLYTALSL